MRLYLLRHATAESGGTPQPDSSRALTAAGRRDARHVGAWLAGRSEPPGFALCSSARRAVETLDGVEAALPDALEKEVYDDLYLASAWKIFELVRSQAGGHGRALLVVGHNPGLAELAARLAEHGDPLALRGLSRRFLPASLAELELPGSSWSELEPAGGTLVSHYLA